MADDKTRYSDKELKEFKDVILKKIEKAEKDFKLIKSAYTNNATNGTDDTSPTFKGFEEGSSTLSKEDNALLAARQEKFLHNLHNALKRIENKTYGICRVTGKLNSKRAFIIGPTRYFKYRSKTRSIISF